MKTKIDTVLAHKNWTGLTLSELIKSGHIMATDKNTILGFVRAALGEARNVETVREYKRIAEEISKAERGEA